jgi:hypothetical protein
MPSHDCAPRAMHANPPITRAQTNDACLAPHPQQRPPQSGQPLPATRTGRRTRVMTQVPTVPLSRGSRLRVCTLRSGSHAPRLTHSRANNARCAASWHANLYTDPGLVEQLEWQGGQVHSRSSTPGAPLYYSTVSKDSAQFSFEQHRQGKVYMPCAHEATNDTYGTYTPELGPGRGSTQIRGQTDDILRYHTSVHQPEQEGPRIQRETTEARVWPEEGATIALQVFLCQRHEFAVTSAQSRADEAAVRKLVIDFLVSRLDDKNALAIWDLGDRAGSHALSDAAFEYVQRHLQVLFHCQVVTKCSTNNNFLYQ